MKLPRHSSTTLTTLDISFGEKKQSRKNHCDRYRAIKEATQPKLTSFLFFQLVPSTLPGSNTSICNTQSRYSLDLNRRFSLHWLTLKPSPQGIGFTVAVCAYVQHSRSTLTSLGVTHSAFTLRDLGASGSFRAGILGKRGEIPSPQAELLGMLAKRLPQSQSPEI